MAPIIAIGPCRNASRRVDGAIKAGKQIAGCARTVNCCRPAARRLDQAGAGIGIHQPPSRSGYCRSSGCRRRVSPYSRRAGPNSRKVLDVTGFASGVPGPMAIKDMRGLAQWILSSCGFKFLGQPVGRDWCVAEGIRNRNLVRRIPISHERRKIPAQHPHYRPASGWPYAPPKDSCAVFERQQVDLVETRTGARNESQEEYRQSRRTRWRTAPE